MEHKNFPHIKSIVSSCICKITNLNNNYIDPQLLNSLSNEYTDKIIEIIKQEEK